MGGLQVDYNVETESNDTFNDADRISLDQEITANLSSDSDWDVFKVNATNPGVLEVNLGVSDNASESNPSYFLGVYNSSYELLTTGYFGQGGSLQAGVSAAGVYYAAVYSSENYINDNYSLSIGHVSNDTSAIETERNDDFTTADSFQIGNSISGQLISTSDADYFKVSPDGVGTVAFTFSSPVHSAVNYFNISVYDQSQQLVYSTSVGADATVSYDMLSTGDLYISITSDEYFTPESYRISSDFTANSNANTDILGTKGSDDLLGTDGDDVFSFMGGNDIIIAGTGTDSFVITGTTAEEFSLKQIRNITALSTENSSKYGDATIRLVDIENVSRGSLDTIVEYTGSDSFLAANMVFGSTVDEKITGSDADEVFDLISGADRLDGGSGNDSLILFEKAEDVELANIDGIYRVSNASGSINYKVTNVEQVIMLDSVQQLETLTAAQVFINTVQSNTVVGTVFDDVIDGGGGSDYINGGAGQDTVVFFTLAKEALIDINRQNDTVSVSFAQTANSEYAHTTTVLKSIEQISFLDADIPILMDSVYKIDAPVSRLIEGEDAVQFSLSLLVEPSSPVTLTLNSSELNLGQSTFEFDSSNWSIAKAFSVVAVDDSTYDLDRLGSISLTLESDDPNFSFQDTDIVVLEIDDDDAAVDVDFISGRIWQDLNQNAQADHGEDGISALAVYIDSNSNGQFDAGEQQAITDDTGRYLFEGLTEDTYSVGIVDAYGWQYTFPNESVSSAISTTLSGNLDLSEITANNYFQDVSSGMTSLRPTLNTAYGGLDGSGQTVVIIDSGIDTDHSFFGGDQNGDGISDQIIYSKTFGSGKSNGEDVGGHGTHVAGIIASSDASYTGVAPGAQIIALKIFDSAGARLEAALDWCLENAEEYSIDVINMSLGSPNIRYQVDDSRYLDAIGIGDELQGLEDLGVVCVASAGNSYIGYYDGSGYVDNYVVESDYYSIRKASSHETSIEGISAPAAYSSTISVGATWASDGDDLSSMDSMNADSLTIFSQRDDELLDVVAYGGGVTSAALGGGTTVLSGTSMSAPYVSGLILLMQQAAEQELGRKLTFDEVKSIINTQSNTTYDGDDEDYNHPYRDVVSSNNFYNVASINNWIEYIAVLKAPLFHAVNLADGALDYNFGLKSNLTNSFTDAAEKIMLTSANTHTYAAGGNDEINGSSGVDTVSGGEGDDIIKAGSGDDIIAGDEGDDILYGETGNDTFKYSIGDGNDILVDFDNATDTIEYAGYTDTQLSQITETTDVNGNLVRLLPDGAQLTFLAASTVADEKVHITGQIEDRMGYSLDAQVMINSKDSSEQLATDSSDAGSFAMLVDSGSDIEVSLYREYQSSEGAITVYDALDALKIAIGLTPSSSMLTGEQLIAADIDQSGDVSVYDALGILKTAIGLEPIQSPEWVFIDTNLDLTGMTARAVSYQTGLDYGLLVNDVTMDFTGILLGDVDGSYTVEIV